MRQEVSNETKSVTTANKNFLCIMASERKEMKKDQNIHT